MFAALVHWFEGSKVTNHPPRTGAGVSSALSSISEELWPPALVIDVAAAGLAQHKHAARRPEINPAFIMQLTKESHE
jgi:hypothetical protein